MKTQFKKLVLAVAIIAGSAASADLRNSGGLVDLDDPGVKKAAPTYNDGSKAQQGNATARLGEKHDLVTPGLVKIQQTIPTIDPISNRLNVDNQINGNETVITVRIAAGSEKREWMNWAKVQFLAQNPEPRVNGKKIAIIIESTGSVVAGNSLRKGNVNNYTVWSPASSFFRPLVDDAYNTNVFETDTPLVSSPLVFLSFNDTKKAINQAVIDKDGAAKPMSFNTVVEVLDREMNGSLQIKKNDWFKFAITDPVQSNSGAMSLVIEAYEYFSRKDPRFRKLEERHLSDPDFKKYLAFQKNYYDMNTTSTGKLGDRLSGRTRDLDAVLVYENVAVEAIKNIKKRGDEPEVTIQYPPLNLLTDHPYYVIKHKTTPEQREAARMFRDFLLEKPQQEEALVNHGFRPSINEITSSQQDKVFGQYTKYGLQPDVGTASKIIPGQNGKVIEALLGLFETLKFEE